MCEILRGRRRRLEGDRISSCRLSRGRRRWARYLSRLLDVDKFVVDFGESDAAAADVQVVHGDAACLRDTLDSFVDSPGFRNTVGKLAESSN